MSLVVVLLLPSLALVLGWLAISNRDDLESRLKKVDAFFKEGAFDKALGLLNDLPASQKMLPENQMRFHRVLFAQKNYYMCLYHLNEIEKRANYTSDLQPYDLRMEMVQVYEAMEKYKKAMEVLEAVLESRPEDAAANQKMGWLLYCMKNYAGALPYLERAHRLGRESGEVLEDNLIYALADSHHHEKQYDRALELAGMVSEGSSMRDRFDLLASFCQFYLGRYSDALEQLKGIEPTPLLNDEVSAVRGLCLYRLGDAEAEAHLEAALRKRKNDHREFVLEARYSYGMLCSKKRNYEELYHQFMLIRSKGTPYQDVQQRVNFLGPLVKQYRLLLRLHEQKDLEAMRSAFESIFRERPGVGLLQCEVFEGRIGVALFTEKASQEQVVLGLAFDLEASADQVFEAAKPFLKDNPKPACLYAYSEGLGVKEGEGVKTFNGEAVLLGCPAMESFLRGEALPVPSSMG